MVVRQPLYIQRAAREGDYILLVFPETAGALAGKAVLLRVKRRLLLDILQPVTLEPQKYVYGVLGTKGIRVQDYGSDLLYTEDIDTLFHAWPALRARPRDVIMYVHYPYNATPLNISDTVPAPAIPISGGAPSLTTTGGAYYSMYTVEDLDPDDPRAELIIPPYVHVGITLYNTSDTDTEDATLLIRVWRYEVRPATREEAERVAKRQVPPEYIKTFSLCGTVDCDVPQALIELYVKNNVPILQV